MRTCCDSLEHCLAKLLLLLGQSVARGSHPGALWESVISTVQDCVSLAASSGLCFLSAWHHLQFQQCALGTHRTGFALPVSAGSAHCLGALEGSVSMHEFARDRAQRHSLLFGSAYFCTCCLLGQRKVSLIRVEYSVHQVQQSSLNAIGVASACFCLLVADQGAVQDSLHQVRTGVQLGLPLSVGPAWGTLPLTGICACRVWCVKRPGCHRRACLAPCSWHKHACRKRLSLHKHNPLVKQACSEQHGLMNWL